MENVIYKIINVVNDKFYVGSTIHTKTRFRQHRKLLRGNRHHCKHLQAAWNKYGEEKFAFVVVEQVEGDLWAAENRWLEQHVGKEYCYNSGRSADAPMRGRTGDKHPSFGKPISEEHKEQISATLKAFYADDYHNHPRVGKTFTPESRAKISESRKGTTAGPNHYRFGKTLSEETRKKIGDTQRGKSKAPYIMSEQGKANIRAAVKRGEESHFYGKRPTNADDMQRAIRVLRTDNTETVYPSLTYIRDTFGIAIGTTIRACKSGKPLKLGAGAGWVLSYADQAPAAAPAIPDEFKHLPRTRQEAKATGAKEYFTGLPCERGHIAPRKTKGTCLVCMREDYKKHNDKKRGKA